MKYIKKAMPIEAFQYKGGFIENGEYCIPDWAIKAYEDGLLYYCMEFFYCDCGNNFTFSNWSSNER